MLQRLCVVIALAAFVFGCGGDKEETKREGTKASSPTKSEPTEEAEQIKAKLQEASETAKQSIVKEEVEKPPLSVEYYQLNDAYEASGFRWEALRKKITEKDARSAAHVKVTLFNGIPELADIYDDMGNHLNIVSYLWKDFKVTGSVFKSANDRMLGMYLFCEADKTLYVHPLSTFRVHAPHTLKVLVADGSMIIEMIDGHNAKEELPAWPRCESIAKGKAPQEKLYQSPFGVHKQVFTFHEDGNLISQASYDLKGGLVEDLRGIAKTETKWDQGRKLEEASYTADELLSRYLFEYDERGRVTLKSVVDKDGKPTVDYFGVAFYVYQHDKRDRPARLIRKDVTGKAYETHEYTYGKYHQVESELVIDGQGTIQTTYLHTYNKKGARTEYAVYDGDRKVGKLKLDSNGVALYRYHYSDKGRLLTESRHGTTQIVDAEGKQDYILANGLDGWALITITYNEEKEHVIDQTELVRVDTSGNKIFDEVSGEEGKLMYRIDRTFAGSTLTESVQTLYDDQGIAAKKIYQDGSKTVVRVALLKYNSDGLLMEEALFAEDEKTPTVAVEGYHKMLKAYTEVQKPQSESYFDMTGNKVKTVMYEYKEDGSFKGTKSYDAEGKEIKEPANP
jgi:hypothetical protein